MEEYGLAGAPRWMEYNRRRRRDSTIYYKHMHLIERERTRRDAVHDGNSGGGGSNGKNVSGVGDAVVVLSTMNRDTR